MNVFLDAGEDVSTAVTYVVSVIQVGSIKSTSILRTELQESLFGIRLNANIKRKISINFFVTHYWTDSRYYDVIILLTQHRHGCHNARVIGINVKICFIG